MKKKILSASQIAVLKVQTNLRAGKPPCEQQNK